MQRVIVSTVVIDARGEVRQVAADEVEFDMEESTCTRGGAHRILVAGDFEDFGDAVGIEAKPGKSLQIGYLLARDECVG